ncbi:HNH endonuclease domain-containing protein [Aliiglaciecola sp. CAU 1673]|uniref:HNH endonuclease n=1 Tax=Aliiglaciecola sp. CAU 1673 TaxID=3032595 RepID=UPI0023D981EE|nr:HNH endonuclease [Aliiglaciecola sp. CAU 1673]MDF2180136.1 HNH endonuclease domain-containing protein [Aliiglaciecola sp. CAU 1673]
MQQQIAFIAYIQRLLVEGDFSATYKYALLHALADVCIEQPMEDESAELTVELDTLVDKFILLYWQHAMPFSAVGVGEEALLLQNAGKQSKVISMLYQCQLAGIRNIRQLKESPSWPQIYRATLSTLKEGPLWRLQILSKQEECFLYPHIKGKNHIKLSAGIAHCFRRFYDLVVYLARNAWLQKIQSIKFNQDLIGQQSQLQDFLFGVDRNALNRAKPILVDIQNNICIYCQKPMKEEKVAIDHFIPFSRYSTDLGHNFVAAHGTCNNSKRDHLAALKHREKWHEQNLIVHAKTLSAELGGYFYCDEQKSLAVSNWAYSVASSTGAKLWVAKNEFMTAGQ